MITAQGTSGFCYDHSLQQTIKEAKEMSRGKNRTISALCFAVGFWLFGGVWVGFCVCLFVFVYLFLFFLLTA